jgi:hypothetical protein
LLSSSDVGRYVVSKILLNFNFNIRSELQLPYWRPRFKILQTLQGVHAVVLSASIYEYIYIYCDGLSQAARARDTPHDVILYGACASDVRQ